MRYYDAETKSLDFEGYLTDLKKTIPGSIVLVQACAHNPTGVDPSEDQWRQIVEVFKERKLLAFFDCAYQGFGSGDVEKDAFSLRLFAQENVQMIIAQSFSKIMGLYGERVGCLHVVCRSQEAATRVLSRLQCCVRAFYSSPAKHGASIAAKILNDPALKAEWLAELKAVGERILKMRELLKAELIKIGTPGNWDHITNQIGMFSFTGLSFDQSTRLVEEKHVYLCDNGRISVAGINAGNVEYTAKAIKEVVE